MKIIDANIVLRYLLEDEKQSFLKASQIIENDDILLTNEIIAEIVYVLEKVYTVPKVEIADILSAFIKLINIFIEDNQLIIEPLVFMQSIIWILLIQYRSHTIKLENIRLSPLIRN